MDGEPSAGDPFRPHEGNAGYDVQHYDLDLRIDPSRRVIQGVATIELTSTEDLRSFTFDLAGFTVTTVDVDGAAALFERTSRKLRVIPSQPLARDRPVVVRVDYVGSPETTDRTGWLWFRKGSALVATQTNGASTLFPCNDHPGDKATFAYGLTTPRAAVGVANGLLVRRSSPDAGTSRFEWSGRQPFPTYAAIVAVGRFRLQQQTGPGGLPILNAFPARDTWESGARIGHRGKHRKKRNRSRDGRKQARKLGKRFRGRGEIISVLEGFLGTYPYSSIGAIVPPIKGLDALEAASRPSYPGVQKVLKDRDFGQLVAHEIAPQWFGNAITIQSWRDVWLNEGFSTYGELLWVAESRNIPIGNLFRRRSRYFGYYEGMNRPPGDPAPGDLFNVTVYNRGALTLEALRRTVGDDPFFKILREWVGLHRGGSVSSEEFIQLSDLKSGRDLGAFFQEWLYTWGLPPLPPEHRAAGKSGDARIVPSSELRDDTEFRGHQIGAGTQSPERVRDRSGERDKDRLR